MGLDNIPKKYPCKSGGTAVMVARQDQNGDDVFDEDGKPVMVIDCQITQQQGGCPWKNANPPEKGLVLGMFGTDCWYRGKYGNYLLEEATISDPMGEGVSFYGDNEDGTEKSPASCLELANVIREALNSYSAEDMNDADVAETYAGLVYAEWYMRWAAEATDGLVCWY